MHPNRCHSPYTTRRSPRGVRRSANYLISLALVVTAGADNRDTTAPGHWRYEAATHLASQLDTPIAELPGAHMAYLGRPRAFAEALRPHLIKLI